jgi:dienelactone hydrolase/pimeloyl-ACP methyl ester carboxylesterase
MYALDRRRWLQVLGTHALALSLLDHRATPLSAAEPAAPLPPLNRFPRMVQEYFVGRVRAAEAARLRAQAALRTRADAEAYVKAVREQVRLCFGPFPERTPLNPRVTGVVDREAYRIEKVIFESRPRFPVTANLYLPKGGKPPLPGVVGTCGHSDNGKAAEAYQAFAQGLARLGYVVLIYDPIGQGERLQYGHLPAKERPRVGVGEHLVAGNQQFLVGEFFGGWRAWDGIRALDYLLSRPEVDPHRVGVTGNSGGGTLTTWLCGLDPRWAMAAPGCFVTTFRRNLENELPADTEQCPPGALARHLDHADFLAALAPRPIILLAKEKDFFDVRGTEEAYQRLKRLYTLLGAPDDIHLFVGPTAHGYTKENREAMYAWFNRVTHAADVSKEPALTIEKDETLWCTPTGQVSGPDARTVFDFTREKSEVLARPRPRLEGDELKRAVASALKLPERAGVPDFRILREVGGRRYPKPHVTTYAVETEPGVFALVYRLATERLDSRPPRDGGPALLYVAHHSADAELRDEPLLRQLLDEEPAATLYTCDVRGIGESRPDTCGRDQFLTPYGSDYFYAIHAIMLDEPYVGRKTFDVLRVLDWLTACGHPEVHLVGRGWGAIPAAFAALLHERVTRVTLKNALTAYGDVAESETYAWPLSSFVPGVLEKFDLPDCYRALQAKKLHQVDPWGAHAGAG